MIGDAAQYVGKPGLWIDAVEFCRGDEGVDCCTSCCPGTGNHAKSEPLPPDNQPIAAFAGCLRAAHELLMSGFVITWTEKPEQAAEAPIAGTEGTDQGKHPAKAAMGCSQAAAAGVSRSFQCQGSSSCSRGAG
jgi:hypothetical protein